MCQVSRKIQVLETRDRLARKLGYYGKYAHAKPSPMQVDDFVRAFYLAKAVGGEKCFIKPRFFLLDGR